MEAALLRRGGAWLAELARTAIGRTHSVLSDPAPAPAGVAAAGLWADVPVPRLDAALRCAAAAAAAAAAGFASSCRCCHRRRCSFCCE